MSQLKSFPIENVYFFVCVCVLCFQNSKNRLGNKRRRNERERGSDRTWTSSPLEILQFISSSQANLIYSVGLKDIKFIFKHNLS